MQFYRQAKNYILFLLLINYKVKRTLYQEFLDINMLEMTSNCIHF